MDEKITFLNVHQHARRWLDGGKVPSFSHFDMNGRDYSDLNWADGIHPGRYKDESSARWDYIKNFGYSVPCAEALEYLRTLEPILEVGAGTGFWSLIMKKMGMDVWTTDLNVGQVDYSFSGGLHSIDQQVDAATAVRSNPYMNVFCSWPSYDEDWLTEAAEAMESDVRLAVVLEECCANDRFRQVVYSEFEEIETGIHMPQFRGLHDQFRVWRKL